ncbi:SusC/RagA family TonB-linked outer membrane protein [Flavobacterium proteolyticum]|uniref:TonB-dependent receptor plug domain-containing protein n=1 Tax=Flavobacterium proteolyticum TaxID=2911683 RepID=A0ABR9WTA4_9FLAO|nr:hypothetical protein [Flavobacterium proteolyticum]MBE9576309.1 hypothetical protein [Flavobacterium proteolyticum]
MKKVFIIFLIIIGCQINAQNDTIKSNNWKNNAKKIAFHKNNALVVIDGSHTSNEILAHLDLSKITDVTVLKKKEAIEKYGEIGKAGVVEIKTKGYSRETLEKLIKIYAFEQKPNSGKTFTITGIVTDCEKFSIGGAGISNLNSKTNTFSDFDGKFEIEVHKNDVLEIYSNGFKTERVLISSYNKIEISLKEDQNSEKIIVAKPVIYLYPIEKTEIDLQLNFKGKLLTSFPKYDKNWEVVAEPNGQIFDKKSNRYYSSLFWDGTIDFPEEHYKYDDGFIVPKEKLAEFFIEKLEYIGLNNQETNEFIQYWLPILERNKYNFIHFLINEECNEIATLKVNPKAETMIRIYIEFYGLENYTRINEQKLPKTERKGFTIVEWGGADFSGEMSEKDFFTINKLPEYITLSHKRKDPKDIQPLYIIDNKISSKKVFDKLQPSQIKKIETYNGEKGAALYGELGVNGVFEITTKNPKK